MNVNVCQIISTNQLWISVGTRMKLKTATSVCKAATPARRKVISSLIIHVLLKIVLKLPKITNVRDAKIGSLFFL